MSRIGLQPIIIPTGVEITLSDTAIKAKGPKGELETKLPPMVEVKKDNDTLLVARKNNSKDARSFHGLTRSLLFNMIQGVKEGYVKKLELVGTGYKAKKQGAGLTIQAGYSHTVDVVTPQGITLDLEGETVIIVSGIDKQLVGHTAAEIRNIRRPEPYKGKGIRYQGEKIRRKAGKATKAGA